MRRRRRELAVRGARTPAQPHEGVEEAREEGEEDVEERPPREEGRPDEDEVAVRPAVVHDESAKRPRRDLDEREGEEGEGELRAEEEKQFWAKRDPLKAFERDLVSDGLVSADELRAIEKEIDVEVQDCVEFALNAPEPDGSELTRYIWADD